MHQSPQKHFSGRREKYADMDTGEADAEAERRLHRGTQPKARRFPLREEALREERESNRHPRG